ncbi:E3 ubiquitin-protein ligase UBR3-like isoform X1 [Gordionus sp. m RMFG-2023]|uniref:E3 ubiquitin-protein ligase UBR3-like isoform X1 n=2 Tax=Gordionus sp. m RMFG-2023 TaxID=3053472 RepID=UPI0031FD22DF
MVQVLFTGGMDLKNFKTKFKKYDFTNVCGLVWNINFIAYRCRDCAVSPCMSICPQCFKGGIHESQNHDYNLFKSQAGGACDCGDINVMKPNGFCHNHNIEKISQAPKPPEDLLIMLRLMSPYLVTKILAFFRECCHPNGEFNLEDLPLCYPYIEFLSSMINTAAPIKAIIAEDLISGKIYEDFVKNTSHSKNLNIEQNIDELDRLGEVLNVHNTKNSLTNLPYNSNKNIENSGTRFYRTIFVENRQKYLQACHNLGTDPEGVQMCQSIDVCDKSTLKFFSHSTVLDELMMWIFSTELPQTLVTFVLQMLNLTDPKALIKNSGEKRKDYKTSFAESVVKHYSCLPRVLMRCLAPDLVSSRLFHISVQLFSNASLAYKMVSGEGNLLTLSINSLNLLILPILIPQGDDNKIKNLHVAVDCSHKIMQSHCYWPVVSDLITLLSHARITLYMLTDKYLSALWTHVLYSFQGMNVNKREKHNHLEFEPRTYYVAFSSEIEVCSSTLQALLCHLKIGNFIIDLNDSNISATSDETSVKFVHFATLLGNVLISLQDWFEVVGLGVNEMVSRDEVTFHLPLHRYLALILSYGVRYFHMTCTDLMDILGSVHPSIPLKDYVRHLIKHPLRIQAALNEINAGLWVRNGIQMKGQVMTYMQNAFNHSMAYPDIFILQICACFIPADEFMDILFTYYNVNKLFPLWCNSNITLTDYKMIEGLLVLISTLLTFRDMISPDECITMKGDMVSLLSKSEPSHSQLIELTPDKSAFIIVNSRGSELFRKFLNEIAEYRPPNLEMGGEISQGSYLPKAIVWRDLYDPLKLMMGDVSRKDYQTSMNKYKEFLKWNYNNKLSSDTIEKIWPPFRLPNYLKKDTSCRNTKLFDFVLPNLLRSSKFDLLLVNVLYDYIKNKDRTPEIVLQLAVYLLGIKLSVPITTDQDIKSLNEEPLISNMGASSHHESSKHYIPTKTVNDNESAFENADHISLEKGTDSDDEGRKVNRFDIPTLTQLLMYRPTPVKFNQVYAKDFSYELELAKNYSRKESPENSAKREGSFEVSNGSNSAKSLLNTNIKLRSVLLSKFASLASLPSGSKNYNNNNNKIFNETKCDDLIPRPQNIVISMEYCIEQIYESFAGSIYIEDHRHSDNNNRIGDGKLFLGNLLGKLRIFGPFGSDNLSKEMDEYKNSNEMCVEGVQIDQETNNNSKNSEKSSKEKRAFEKGNGMDKKKFARERQKKIMNSYVSKQKKFIQHVSQNPNLFSHPSSTTIDISNSPSNTELSGQRVLEPSFLDQDSSAKEQSKREETESSIISKPTLITGTETCAICGMLVRLEDRNCDQPSGLIVFTNNSSVLGKCWNPYLEIPDICDVPLATLKNSSHMESNSIDYGAEYHIPQDSIDTINSILPLTNNRYPVGKNALDIEAPSSSITAPRNAVRKEFYSSKLKGEKGIDKSILNHMRGNMASNMVKAYSQYFEAVKNESSEIDNIKRLGSFDGWVNSQILSNGLIPEQWLYLIKNFGWDKYTHLTTCGHYLHYSCYKSYMDTLQNQSNAFNSSVISSLGEFNCPICRHISNRLIPVYLPKSDSHLYIRNDLKKRKCCFPTNSSNISDNFPSSFNNFPDYDPKSENKYEDGIPYDVERKNNLNSFILESLREFLNFDSNKSINDNPLLLDSDNSNNLLLMKECEIQFDERLIGDNFMRSASVPYFSLDPLNLNITDDNVLNSNYTNISLRDDTDRDNTVPPTDDILNMDFLTDDPSNVIQLDSSSNFGSLPKYQLLYLFSRLCSVLRINLEAELVRRQINITKDNTTGNNDLSKRLFFISLIHRLRCKLENLRPLKKVLDFRSNGEDRLESDFVESTLSENIKYTSQMLVDLWSYLNFLDFDGHSDSTKLNLLKRVLCFCDPCALLVTYFLALKDLVFLNQDVILKLVRVFFFIQLVQIVKSVYPSLPTTFFEDLANTPDPYTKLNLDSSEIGLFTGLIRRLLITLHLNPTKSNADFNQDFPSNEDNLPSTSKNLEIIRNNETFIGEFKDICYLIMEELSHYLSFSYLLHQSIHIMHDEDGFVLTPEDEEDALLTTRISLLIKKLAIFKENDFADDITLHLIDDSVLSDRYKPSMLILATLSPFSQHRNFSWNIDQIGSNSILHSLPANYETLFSRYYGARCFECMNVPSDPGICLACGTLVCVKDACCAKNTIFEAVSHSTQCGSGTSIYQIVNSGSILIICEHRACVWASLYLDCHGEEDKNLKRGKPLYLCNDRLRYLQNMYLTDSFLTMVKRWTWHLNIL